MGTCSTMLRRGYLFAPPSSASKRIVAPTSLVVMHLATPVARTPWYPPLFTFTTSPPSHAPCLRPIRTTGLMELAYTGLACWPHGEYDKRTVVHCASTLQTASHLTLSSPRSRIPSRARRGRSFSDDRGG
jgi:hypothetical protein